jgi:AbiV family abortive infection protein
MVWIRGRDKQSSMNGASVGRKDLIVGARLALSHAIDLLWDALHLYTFRRYPGSFGSTVMAREELGRCNFLLLLHARMTNDETIPADQLVKKLLDHKAKLDAGQLVVQFPISKSKRSAMDRAIRGGDMKRAAELFREIASLAGTLKPQQVAALHRRRLTASYVNLDPQSGAWSAPSEVGRDETTQLLHAVTCEVADVVGATQQTLGVRLTDADGAPRDVPMFIQDISARLYRDNPAPSV